MIKAIAIDDEPLALVIIETFCSRTDFIQLEKTFTDTVEAQKYLRKYPVDLMFLDINMPAMSGLDFYKAVPQQTMVIFTTAYSEYAVEGFNLSAVDYLLKPFDFDRFLQAVNKVKDYKNVMNSKEESEKHLFIRSDYSLMKIDISEIAYIEGLDNYIKLHFKTDKKPILTRMSMKAMEEKLSPKQFMRVHRSFIVPLDDVLSVRNKVIFLGNKEIPIGTNYIDKVYAFFKIR